MLDRETFLFLRLLLGFLLPLLAFVLLVFIGASYIDVLLEWVLSNVSVWIWGPLAAVLFPVLVTVGVAVIMILTCTRRR